jgi:hypothetical protein
MLRPLGVLQDVPVLTRFSRRMLRLFRQRVTHPIDNAFLLPPENPAN